MDSIASFQQARAYYSNHWSIERRKVLNNLKAVLYINQNQAQIKFIGCLMPSNLIGGFLGGLLAIGGVMTAPNLLGTSLGSPMLATVRADVASFAAGVTLEAVKNAKESLDKHSQSCKEMMRLIGQLQRDIETIEKNMKKGMTSHGTDALRAVKSGTILKDVAKGVSQLSKLSKLSTEALCVPADMGILQCNEAEKLQKVIEKMQKEYDDLTESFS